MSRIAVIAYETTRAVNSSMMMHVDMMADCGHDITLVVSSKVNNDFFKEFEYKIRNYSSKKELKEILKQEHIEAIWCTNSVYVLYLTWIRIKLPIYLWMQGDTPAESYMAHHSKIRRYLLQRVVSFSFRKVKGIVYVSTAMKEYYESHYRKTPSNNIIVPCLSEFDAVEVKKERIPCSFVYIGGLAVWQCFDEMLNLYKSVRTKDSLLHIITLDNQAAHEKVRTIIGDEDNIEIYGITDRHKIPEVLSQFQYGFLIRRNDVVNLVSSPIKFLEYISCGVDVIMTDAVASYAKIVEDYGIGTVVSIDKVTKIKPFSNRARSVYKELFNRDMYVERYKKLLQ